MKKRRPGNEYCLYIEEGLFLKQIGELAKGGEEVTVEIYTIEEQKIK